MAETDTQAAPVVSRCKICLKEFTDVETYNEHIESFQTEEEYAAHVKQRPTPPIPATE